MPLRIRISLETLIIIFAFAVVCAVFATTIVLVTNQRDANRWYESHCVPVTLETVTGKHCFGVLVVSR